MITIDPSQIGQVSIANPAPALASESPRGHGIGSNGDRTAPAEIPKFASPRQIGDGPWAWATKDALRHINETFADSGLLVSARSVYLALCEVASDKQAETFQISVAAICARSGVGDRWARKLLHHLRQAGVVAIRENKAAGGLNLPSTYTLLARPALSAARPAVSAARPVVASGISPAATADVRRMEEKEERRSTPSPPSRRVRAWEGGVKFQQFWDAYPKKRSKAAAEKAWAKMDCGELLDDILAALRLAIESDQWTKEGGRYIPHPANWLSAKGWEDDYSPSEGPAPAKEKWREDWLPWLRASGHSLPRNSDYQFAEPWVKDQFWHERLAAGRAGR